MISNNKQLTAWMCWCWVDLFWSWSSRNPGNPDREHGANPTYNILSSPPL